MRLVHLSIVGAVALAPALSLMLLSVGSEKPASAQGGTTTRVSVDSAGNQANDQSYSADISANGRYVVFASGASNLVPGDTNNKSDIFIHDAQTGATERVSVDSAGNEANGYSPGPAVVSADGRYVAFVSQASNLVPGDTNATADVFIRDRQMNTTERISVDSAMVQANGPTDNPSVSADGRYVAFESTATNLVPGDMYGWSDVFVRDRQTGLTERISVDNLGNGGNGGSNRPAISASGQFVAFYSSAANLVPDDVNGAHDIFVRDLGSDTTELISVDSSENQQIADPYQAPAISADGRYVAFASFANNLVPGDTNPAPDVFVRDREAGTTERVSVGSSGNEADSVSGSPKISADGRYVAFYSQATNLVPNDANYDEDVFVRDRSAGTTELVSVDSAGNGGSRWSSNPAMSADGRYVAFTSIADNLVSGDTNGSSDVFVHDRQGKGSTPTVTDTLTASATPTATTTATATVADTTTATPTNTPTATNTFTPSPTLGTVVSQGTSTPTVTPPSTPPTPASVGGISHDPAISASPLASEPSSSSGAWLLTAGLAIATASAVVLSGGVWYIRMRR